MLKERLVDLEARVQRQASEIEATYALLGREYAERCRAEAALKTAYQMAEGLFSHAPIAIEIFDREGFSFRMNEANRRLLGAPDPERGGFNVLSDPLIAAQGLTDLYARAYAGEVVQAPNLTIFPLFDEEGAVSAVLACSAQAPGP
jgi:PAS domain-containing protein